MVETVTKAQLNKVDAKFLVQVNELKNLSVAEDKKVGAIIANHITGELITLGYNKMFDDLGFSTCEDEVGQSLPYVIHAEESAVIEFLKKQRKVKHNLQHLTIYCSYAPCINCAKYICHLGIKRIMYDDKHNFKFDRCKNSPKDFLLAMNVKLIEVIKDFEDFL